MTQKGDLSAALDTWQQRLVDFAKTRDHRIRVTDQGDPIGGPATTRAPTCVCPEMVKDSL